MTRDWRGPLAMAAVLLASCSARTSDRETSPPTAEPRDASANLPTESNEAIDLASLQGRIAFGVDGDIEDTEVHVVDADGSGLVRLTRNKAADFDPSWSPDGSRIVFRSQRDGNDEIYVMNADGSQPRNLTREPSVDRGPEWSADGRWIAFNSGRDHGIDLHGFVMDPQAKGLRSLGDLFVEYPSRWVRSHAHPDGWIAGRAGDARLDRLKAKR